MKKIFILMSAVALTSCEDFITLKSNDVMTDDALTEENLELLAAPLYNVAWFNYNNTFSYGIGDGMAYNIDHNADYIQPYAHLTVTGQTANLVEAWGAFYGTVSMANSTIATLEGSSLSSEKKESLVAEVRFMRSLAYWYLTSLWGDAIISADATSLSENPIVNKHKARDVWEFLLRDMEYAAKYLPETSIAAGRVNKYSAYAFLSRFYLDYSGFKASNYGENPNVNTRDAEYLELARKAAAKVIDQGPFGLVDNYGDLFTIAFNNCKESIFAFQWIPGIDGGASGNYGYTNSTARYLSFHASLVEGSGGWGGWTNATYDVMLEYAQDNDYERRYATFMGAGDSYPELNTKGGGFTVGDASEGSNTYNSGHSPYNSCLNIRKGITGNASDNPAVNSMNSALKNNVMRFSEVLLNYAEAVLGNNASTTDPVALEYFNEVRTRAKVTPKASVTWDDIRHERRLEFCMEGRYWYDLVARAYYRQQEVIAMINNQKRGEPTPFLFDAPMDLRVDPDRDVNPRSVGEAKPATFRLPYPEEDLLKNPLLGKPAVDYTFSGDRITGELFN